MCVGIDPACCPDPQHEQTDEVNQFERVEIESDEPPVCRMAAPIEGDRHWRIRIRIATDARRGRSLGLRPMAIADQRANERQADQQTNERWRNSHGGWLLEEEAKEMHFSKSVHVLVQTIRADSVAFFESLFRV